MATKPATLPPEQFNEILRVVRETVRTEIRAEFEARRAAYPRDVLMTADGLVMLDTVDGYKVPTTMHGQPI